MRRKGRFCYEKAAVIYWSGTGNTEAMANAVAGGHERRRSRGLPSQRGRRERRRVSPGLTPWRSAARPWAPKFSKRTFSSRCSPSCKKQFVGKSAALFGSYGWGDGEWMRTWEQDCRGANISLACESVICCETPGDIELEACRELGRELVK